MGRELSAGSPVLVLALGQPGGTARPLHRLLCTLSGSSGQSQELEQRVSN